MLQATEILIFAYTKAAEWFHNIQILPSVHLSYVLIAGAIGSLVERVVIRPKGDNEEG